MKILGTVAQSWQGKEKTRAAALMNTAYLYFFTTPKQQNIEHKAIKATDVDRASAII